jgi:hypothetical protein
MLGGGYYWYSRQREVQQRLQQDMERFKPPPYFVNHGVSVIRSCQHCLETAGKLKPQSGWKVWGPQEIRADQLRWFLAVEDPPLPVTVSGVLMLPVHPALNDNPALGFDLTRVELVLYQNLERKSAIEQLPPPVQPPAPAPEPPAPSPTEPPAVSDSASRTAPEDALPKLESPFVGYWKNIDPGTQSLTRLLIAGHDDLTVHAWARCQPVECDWGSSSSVPLPQVDRGFVIFWDHKYAIHTQAITLEPGDRLKVSLRTHFTQNSGRRDLEIVSYFVRSTDTP